MDGRSVKMGEGEGEGDGVKPHPFPLPGGYLVAWLPGGMHECAIVATIE